MSSVGWVLLVIHASILGWLLALHLPPTIFMVTGVGIAAIGIGCYFLGQAAGIRWSSRLGRSR
jgi:hypothetical protein